MNSSDFFIIVLVIVMIAACAIAFIAAICIGTVWLFGVMGVPKWIAGCFLLLIFGLLVLTDEKTELD